MTMSTRKRHRLLRDRDNLLQYVVMAFIVCVITTYLIYRKITTPHTGGIPKIFWEEMTSNRSRDVIISETKGRLLDKLKSAKRRHYSRNTLIYNKQRNTIILIDACYTGSRQSLTNTSLFSCTHIMNLTGSMGRTGNQMFQVAALLATAYKHGYTPVIKRFFPLARWFKLPNLVDIRPINSQIFNLKKCGTYSPRIEHIQHSTNWSLHGYFQSWKFFLGAEHVIRDAFQLKEKYVNCAKEFLSNVTKPGHPNVCVHIRRGDLNTKDLSKKGFTIPSIGYIYRAMDVFRKQFDNKVQFIVLSDGMFWCMDHIHGSDVIFSPFLETAEDMALMTLCNHVIITSGTFGWWGAWLSGGQTIYYKGYPRQNSWLSSQLNMSEYYPPHWTGLW